MGMNMKKETFTFKVAVCLLLAFSSFTAFATDEITPECAPTEDSDYYSDSTRSGISCSDMGGMTLRDFIAAQLAENDIDYEELTADGIKALTPTELEVSAALKAKIESIDPDDLLDALSTILKDQGDKITNLKTMLNNFQKLEAGVVDAYDFTQTTYETCGEDASDAETGCSAKPTFTKMADSLTDMSNIEKVLDVASFRCSMPDGGRSLPALEKFTPVGEIQAKLTDIQTQYASQKDEICNVVAKLHELLTKLQQLEAIREDGVPLLSMYRSHKHDFGGVHRTTTLSVDMRFYPDLQTNYENDFADWRPNISIENDNSYFKFSDDGKHMLGGGIDNLLDNQTTDPWCSKGLFWFKFNEHIKLKISLQNVTESSADIGACIEFGYGGHDFQHSFHENISPLPFGYMAQVTEMKDSGKQKLTSTIAKEVSSLLGSNSKIDQLTDKLSQVGANKPVN
jgi:hypothetical protein